MNGIQSNTSKKARDYYWASDFDQAFSNYLDSFEANPKAWWLAMEAIRCKRAIIPHIENKKRIVYSPEYVNNSYQPNLYAESKRFKYEVNPVNNLVIDEQLVGATFSCLQGK